MYAACCCCLASDFTSSCSGAQLAAVKLPGRMGGSDAGWQLAKKRADAVLGLQIALCTLGKVEHCQLARLRLELRHRFI